MAVTSSVFMSSLQLSLGLQFVIKKISDSEKSFGLSTHIYFINRLKNNKPNLNLMKSTFSHLSSFWVKVLPVMLVLLSIGITRTQAQNYKPLNEAVTAVSNAADLLKSQGGIKAVVNKSNGNGQATTGGLTPAQISNSTLVVFELAYYSLFIEKAKIAGEVAQAVIDLDATVNTQGQPQSRVATINTARANLMALITN
jgi:hypothetical protein